mmetsp:Transcript_31567/g.75017  ORF Transcript_31567/g.75017 Transcript_31567/m.75017 type:complete len:463 (-) Transcript_31567:45-1433(-)
MDFSFLQSLGGRQMPSAQKAVAQPRQALQPVEHNVLQRIKNFIGEPATSSAVKKAKTPSKEASNRTPSKRSISSRFMSPVRLLHLSATTAAPKQQQSRHLAMLSDDIMQLVVSSLDMESAFKARAVCKSWKKMVTEAGTEPLEAGVRGQSLVDGLQTQRMLESSLQREAGLFDAKHRALIGGHMGRQQEVTTVMRKTLVNWLIEVHFKFRFREPSLGLTLQLLDRFMSLETVTRRRYQTVGVTAFMLGVKFEERHNPSLGDLSYITDYSSSRQQILDMEKEMLVSVNYDLVHPKPTDFTTRLLHAAGLEEQQKDHLPKGEYTTVQAIVHFFLDAVALDEKFLGIPPSTVTAAAISCALSVQGLSNWNTKLGFYSKVSAEEGTALAARVLQSAKLSVLACNCMTLKYSAPRMGGDKAKNIPGIFEKLKAFLAALPAPRHPTAVTWGNNAPVDAPGPAITYALV